MSTPKPPQPGDAQPGGAADTPHLADTPGYPLARGVEMPDTLDYPTGALSFRLGALRLRTEGRPETIADETRGGVRHVTRHIPALVLTGRYALDARPDEIREIDTAGNLRPLSEEAVRPTLPAGARPSGPGHPDPRTVKRWTDRADAHRTKLMKTEQGRQVLIEYGTHNESYYDVFNDDSQTSRNLRTKWAEKGTTQRMSEHTYGATDPDASLDAQPPVNDWQDPQTDVAYNLHAWRQRTTVVSTLNTAAKVIEHTDPGKASRFRDAAKATERFSKAVHQTGNNDQQTTPMNQDAVYAAIDQHSGELPAVSAEEMARYDGLAALGIGAGEAAPALRENEPEHQPGWIALSDEDRAIVQQVGAAAYHDHAEQSPRATDTLHTGECGARLEGVRITTRLAPDGTPVDASVELPDLTLQIDDAGWQGTAADVARERLTSMRFVRHLLSDAVAETVRHAALTGMTGYAHPQDGRS
ncbi:hypothetical protein [Streptomyces sp. NPDC008001]|uniref:hypothetical protein n=1 Tax=Streptomyces sp. NPDC008001 TaxID=3364804 RepID=UPI0036E96634